MTLSTEASENNFQTNGAFSNMFDQNPQQQPLCGFSQNSTGIIGDRNNLQPLNTTNWSENDNAMYNTNLSNKDKGGFGDLNVHSPMGRHYQDDNSNLYGKHNQRAIMKSQSTLNAPYDNNKYLDISAIRNSPSSSFFSANETNSNTWSSNIHNSSPCNTMNNGMSPICKDGGFGSVFEGDQTQPSKTLCR